MKVLENLTGPELLNQVYGKYEKSDSKIEFFGRYSQNELEGILNNTMEEKHELERCIKKITNFMKSLKGFSIWKTKKLRNCQEEVLVTRNHVHTIDFQEKTAETIKKELAVSEFQTNFSELMKSKPKYIHINSSAQRPQ